MNKKIASLLIALVMLLQIFAPQTSFAEENVRPTHEKYVKIGVINAKSYDAKIMNALNREAAKNRKIKKATPGARLFSRGPYFGEGNEPGDKDKPKYYGNINVDFNLSGLDGNPFQWNEIFGVDEQGNPKPAQIIFTQSDNETGDETGVEYILKVTKTGKYTWSDKNGNPTKLPLFSKTLKPFSYEARVDEDVAENIKLLTARMTGTEGSSPTFLPENAEGEIIANITLDLGLQQVASTKFKSEWKTNVAEAQRPQIQGTIAEKVADLYDNPVVFDLPKNNKDVKIIRDWEDAFEEGLMVADALYKTPTVGVNEIDANGLTFDTAKKTVKSGGHTYKYALSYDVINGGKLTMTEVLPLTFDANGGKFASITEESADQKIVKEVDYGKDLLDNVEKPTKDREIFKGWGIKDPQGEIIPADDTAFKNITGAKTFYAIWEDMKLKANGLEVHESYKAGGDYVNDFIPTLDKLKGTITAGGNPLTDDDELAILDDAGTPQTGEAAKEFLYGKLREENDNQVSRTVEIKGQVTYKNGKKLDVTIPIKVIKNIYEAKTEEGKPNYVPADYVKVTVDPTTKAKAPQKYVYYVNPEAQVAIPGKDPEGTGDNKFIKWTIPGTPDPTKYEFTERHQFKSETTITAQYSADVVPQEGANKPDGVPEGFVKVTFVPTDNGTMEGAKIFWVNPAVAVKIPVKDPVGNTYYTFKEWKMGVNADGDAYKPGQAHKFEQATTITATYDEAKTIIPFDPKNPDSKKTPEGYVKVTFKAETGLELTNSKAYYVKKNAVDGNNAALTLKAIKDDATNYGYPEVKEQTGYTFEKWDPEETTHIGESDILVTAKVKTADDVIEKKDGLDQPKGYVEVTFVPTDMATDETEKTFWVNPTKKVTIPMAQPVGKTVKADAGNPQEYAWVFKNWTSDEAPSRTWSKDIETGVTAKFSVDTKITAHYDKNITDQGKVTANEITVHESFKDGDTWINNFIKSEDTEAKLKAAIKVKNASGADKDLPADATVAFLDDGGNPIADDALKMALYDKLQEKANPNDEPTRVEKVKVQVTFKNGEVQTVDIPIKVIKNIYEAKTEMKPPYYVPKDYVKVTLNPTKKATDSQKTYYYVNPKAKVIIPGTDPTGTGDNKFIKWTMKADDAADDVKGDAYKLTDRHQFEKASTITAQYSADVVPQEGANKPDGVPEGFVKVTFVPTDNGTMEGTKIFWVNPAVEVTIPVKNPKGKTYYTFKEWKMGADATGDKFDPAIATRFTAQETIITATYTEGDKIIPFNPEDANPMARPEGYVKVTFKAETGLKFKESKAYYVKKDAGIALKAIKDDATKGYPGYDVVKGYKFDKWDLPETTEIKDKDLVVTAKASSLSDVVEKKEGDTKPEGYVEVSFVPTDKAVDTATKTFWVNPEKEVTIPVTNPKGTTYYTFKEWVQADGTVYKPTVAQKFTAEKTTITATYDKAEDIIAYDPKEPKAKPEGYVRVTFEAEEGLTLSNVQAYYVKKDANITLGNVKLVKPTPAAKTGYTFKEWDKKDNLVLGAEDVVVKALANTLPDRIEKKQGEQKPDGYVEVKFVAGENGKLTANNAEITEKAYYVNPGKYVTITPPTAVGNTGYEFGAWDKDAKIPTQYKDQSTTIKASFNQLKDVVPKTKDNDSEKPAGYKTVTFVIEGEGGSIVDGQTKVYYVDPNREVTITPPTTLAKTGYAFEKWDQDTVKTAKKYTGDTTVKGNFKKLEDIIPSTNDQGKDNAKPDGYITITFDKGDHGTKIEGQTTYYVNPKAGKTLANITKPTVTPDTGWKQKATPNAWDKPDAKELKGSQDIIVKAQYESIADVVPKDNPQGGENTKPDGYITVTFKSTDKGSIGSTVDASKVVYVNPNKAVVLKEKAPAVTGIPGYQFAGWDVSIDQAIQYKDKTVITAQYNKSGDISKVPVPDYVKVEFKPGTNGTLTGTTDYWIKPGVEVTIPAPGVDPKVGYKFDKWDNPLTVTRQAGVDTYTITATYADEQPVIPKTKPDDSEKPKGYVTVTFTTDGNGSLEGTTTYFVNPNKEADFTQTVANMAKKPKIGYTEKGGTWSSTDFKQTFKANAEFKFSFVKLKNVIPAVEGEARPEGYVTVTLIPTDKATDQTKAKKSFWVKANTDISITSKPTGKTEKLNEIEFTHTFKGWSVTRGTIASWDNETIAGKFIQDTEITAQYTTKVDWKDLVATAKPKDNAVTSIGDKPKPEDLIGNPYDPKDPDNKNNLPKDSKISYAENGEPSVDKDGKVTAKVKIEYPGGKTTVIDVPLTVVKTVVPQTGGEGGSKPLVPDSYVKVTVDTTETATDNTKFVKVFWVKPDEEVAIDDVKNPTGKEVTKDGVTKTNKFVKWQRQGVTPDKFYETEIKDTFAKGTETTIVAVYEQGKNVAPVGKDTPWIPQGSKPSPKDFINNPYNDNDPNNKDNLPPGTKLEFVPGKEPKTDQPGKGETTIKITYPNGEVKEVPVKYRVTGDVVEQTDPNDPSKKPAVPDTFVKVIVDKTKDAQLADGEHQTRVFWVNPNKEVTLDVKDPTGDVVKDGQGQTKKDRSGNDIHYRFTGWDVPLKQQFTQSTTITAQYEEEPQSKLDFGRLVITTYVDKQPTEEDYRELIKETPFEKDVSNVKITKQPDVSKVGWTEAEIELTFKNNEVRKVTVPVKVLEKETKPGGSTGGGGSIVVPSTPQPAPNKPSEGDLNKDDHYQYLIGYPDGTFAPNRGMTRAEVATMFTRLLKDRPVKWLHYSAGLSDIYAGDWYADTVGYAVQKGIVSGYPDGTFKPNQPITRAEFASIASRFAQLTDDQDISFIDLDASHWGYKAVRSAASHGWISGYPDGSFRPEKAISRAEVTSITNRMLNRYADLDWIDAHRDEVIRFSDVGRSDWYFEPVMEATMGHDFTRDADGKTEHWSGLNGKTFI